MNQENKIGLSIFSRLLITLLASALLVSGMLTVTYYVYNRRALEQQTTERIQQQFLTISYHFRSELKDTLVKDLRLLSSNPMLDDYLMSSESEREINARALERFFLESLKYSSNYESISFVNFAGTELVKVNRSGRVRVYRNLGQEPLFQRIRNGKPGLIDVGDPMQARNGSVLFTAAISKTDADIGRFGGAVIVELEMKDFLAYLSRITLFDKNPLWLFAPDGTVLVRPREQDAQLDPKRSLTAAFQKEPVLARTKDGLIVYQDLYISPDRPLFRLAVSVPSSLLTREMRHILRFFMGVSALALLLSAALAYVLAGYLSRPVVELADAASRLAAGDLTTRVKGKSSGEVHLLIDSFNRMASDLERTTVSKDYVDNVIGSMRDALIIASPSGIISRINMAASFLLGYDEAELAGQPLSKVIQDEPGAGTTLEAVLQNTSVSTVEKTYLTKSGKKVPVLFSASIMRDKEDRILAIVCVAQDITARKLTEAMLKAYSDDLQEVNEELKNFAYIVSHDLRAPLVNIKGFSEELILGIREIGPLLEKYLAGFEPAERKKFQTVLAKDIPEALDFIGSSVTRMDNLINAILKLSRAGRRKLNPEPVCTEVIVRSILASLAHQIESRGISVKVGSLCDLVVDKMALEQIFGNLIDNAIKYLEPGRPGELEIWAVPAGPDAVFFVRDNGRGMEKNDIPKAFEIFRRVGRQDVPGEGMGLAYVKTLVRLLGGHIGCESVPGRGTTFSFSLPLAVETVERADG